MKTIHFTRETNFTGRNGYMKMKGIELLEVDENNILLTAVTSKGKAGRCDMKIPKEHLFELITSLAETMKS